MPLLGLGTYKTTDDKQLKQEILEAFSCGYHLIDTASFYMCQVLREASLLCRLNE